MTALARGTAFAFLLLLICAMPAQAATRPAPAQVEAARAMVPAICNGPGALLLPGCAAVEVGEALVGAGSEAVTGAVDAAVDSGARNLGEVMMGAWDSLMKDFLTSWLNQGLLVDLDGSSVPWLTDQLQVIGVGLSVIGIMVACIWTMVHTRGDRAKQAATSLFRVFLVTTLGTAFVQVLLPFGDAFSEWILDSAGVSANQWEAKATAAVVATNPGIAILAGLLGALATLFQWVIMVIRAALIPLLVAVWPTAAAAAMIQGGEQAFAGVTRWLIAFVIYKPVAAIIYAFAWKLKSGDDGVGGVINGMIVLVLGVMALPALMRLIAPGASALGSAAGGTMALAATGAVVAAGVAAGAAVVTGGASMAGGAAASAGSASSAGGGLGATAGGTPPAPSGGTSASVGASGSPGDTGPSGASGQKSSGADSPGVTAPGADTAGVQAAANSVSGTIAQGSKNSDVDGLIGGGDQ